MLSRELIPSEAPKPKVGVRGQAQLKGNQELLKIGCPVRYSVTYEADGVVTVRVPCVDHTHETATMERFLPGWVKDVIRAEWLEKPKIGAEALCTLIRDLSLKGVLVEDKEKLFYAWDTTKEAPPRALVVTTKEVNAVLRELEASVASMHKDDAKGVALFVEDHRKEMFLYRPGVASVEGVVKAARALSPWCKAYTTAYTTPSQNSRLRASRWPGRARGRWTSPCGTATGAHSSWTPRRVRYRL